MHNITGKLLVLCLLFIIPLNGQCIPSDSLKTQLITSKGVARLEILNQLIDQYLYSNSDTAYFYANSLLKEAGNADNKKYMTFAWRGISICNFYMAEYYQAEEDILNAIKLQEQIIDNSGLANSYKILTGIYWETERYDKSSEISFKALKLYELQKDTIGIISSLNNIGLIYKRTGDSNKSLALFKKALSQAENSNIQYNKGNLYNNIGITFKVIAQYDSALYYYHKALSEYQIDSLKGGIATVYFNIGNIFLNNKSKSDSALIYLNKALVLANETDKTQLTGIYSGLGKYYMQKNNYNKSIEAYKKGLAISNTNNDIDDEKDVHYNLYSIYKEIGNISKAFTHLEKYTILKDTLAFENTRVTIAKLESKFEIEKKQLQIEKLKEKQKADKHIKSLLWIGIIFLFLTLSLTIIIFKQKRKKAKLRRILLKTEKEKLEKDIHYKSRQLTSQALIMMQKNSMLGNMLNSFKQIKNTKDDSKQIIQSITYQLKRSLNSKEDWKTFRHYFEEVNPDFYTKILLINNKITPSELKLIALIKLNFNIKESASLLNISPDSVKTTRHVLRIKLGLVKEDNIYEFLNKV